jgi:hypothetical protein
MNTPSDVSQSLNAIPDPVAVTNPPHQTSGNVAHASTHAQRWGHGDDGDADGNGINQ